MSVQRARLQPGSQHRRATSWALVLLAATAGCRTPRADAEALRTRVESARAAERSAQEPECLGAGSDPVAPSDPLDLLLPEEVDRAQAELERRIKVGARWIDGFLGDERSIAEENETWARLRLDTRLEDRDGVDFGASVNGRLVLPGTERRLNLVLSGSGDEDSAFDFLAEDPATQDLAGTDVDNASTALQYFLRATRRNNVRLELGVKFSGGTLDPYAGARWRHTLPLAAWTLRLSERLRAYVERGWESQTRLDLERPLSEALFFRSTSRGDVSEEEDGWFLAQDLALYRRLSGQRLVAYEVGGQFVTEPETELDQAYVRVRYSQRFARDWIRLELTPQLAWREEYDYQPVGGLLVRLDLEVGRSY